MLGATASRLYRVTGLLFRAQQPHQSRNLLSHSVHNCSISSITTRTRTRSSFHGNPILLPQTCNTTSRRIIPLRINAFVFGTSSAPSPPDGRVWLSTAAPDQRNPTPLVPKRTSGEQVGDVQIFRTLASYLWMKDNYEFRLRVITALGFLVGAKVLNVQVPFLFKLAVDWLTTATGNAGTLASFSAANSTQLALFATPVSVLIGYGIARSGASAFNGTRHEVIACSYHSFGYSCFNNISIPFVKSFRIGLCRIKDCCVF